MGSPNNESYHHGNLREEILRVGLLLLDEEGLSGVGVRQIARKIGVAHSAPANHFKNKKALMTALASEIFASLARSIREQLALENHDLSGVTKIFAQELLAFGLAYPQRYLMIFQTDLLDMKDPSLNESMDMIYETLLTLLSSHSSNPRYDLHSKAIALWSMIHGYVELRLNGSLEPRDDSISMQPRLDAMIDLFNDGLGAQ